MTSFNTEEYSKKALLEIEKCTTHSELLQTQSEFLGKESLLAEEIKSLAKLSTENKKIVGSIIHSAKNEIFKNLSLKKKFLDDEILNKKLEKQKIDISMPVDSVGAINPITKIRRRIENIFCNLGFSVASGPEIESDFYNFSALNIPENHSARADHDTFYFDADLLLRTHTSTVQIHTLQKEKPPIHIICPGRVYRKDYDVTHTPMFHQVEGLVVDSENISISNLKWLITGFLQSFFAKEVKVRFRPSYFPFTEPSFEVDIGCVFCKSKGCRVCSHTTWIEVLGAGMVHPNVLSNVGLDSNVYKGIAFGLGVERLTMLYYGINDLRTLYENNLSFLNSFKGCK